MSEQLEIKDGGEFREEPPIRNRAVALEILGHLFNEFQADTVPEVQAILDRHFPGEGDYLEGFHEGIKVGEQEPAHHPPIPTVVEAERAAAEQEPPTKNAALALEILGKRWHDRESRRIQAIIDRAYPEKVQLIDGVLRPVPWGGATEQEPRPDTDPDLGDVEKLARWALGAPEKDEEPTIGTTIARAFLSLLAAHDALKRDYEHDKKVMEMRGKAAHDHLCEAEKAEEERDGLRLALEAEKSNRLGDNKHLLGERDALLAKLEWETVVRKALMESSKRLAAEVAKEKARADADEAKAGRLREALDELTDLVEAAYRGEYEIDSFTTQPARAALRGEQEGEG